MQSAVHTDRWKRWSTSILAVACSSSTNSSSLDLRSVQYRILHIANSYLASWLSVCSYGERSKGCGFYWYGFLFVCEYLLLSSVACQVQAFLSQSLLQTQRIVCKLLTNLHISGGVCQPTNSAGPQPFLLIAHYLIRWRHHLIVGWFIPAVSHSLSTFRAWFQAELQHSPHSSS
jgi:hypothetical protein